LKQYPDIKIFINVSASSIGSEEFLEFILEKIESYNVNPCRFGFEITETEALQNISTAKTWIRTLKNIGCPFALDDFGTGFSSFSYLQSLPVDFLKIDGSFVRDIVTNKQNQTLVRAMNEVAILLGKESIVEFVENKEIYLKLKELNIKNFQGYYFGRPVKLPKDLEGSN
jgi:EAL domain-containing protein (putative c-di-GMP-specific phosphodiesterase class I)